MNLGGPLGSRFPYKSSRATKRLAIEKGAGSAAESFELLLPKS